MIRSVSCEDTAGVPVLYFLFFTTQCYPVPTRKLREPRSERCVRRSYKKATTENEKRMKKHTLECLTLFYVSIFSAEYNRIKQIGREKEWITLDVLNKKVDYTVNLPKEVIDALLVKSHKN